MSPAADRIRVPVLFLGFKAYAQATGRRALRLADMAQEVTKETGISIALIPQFTDIWPIAQATSAPVFAQHIDPIEPGSHTGYVLAEAVKEAGATGTLINHSERRLEFTEVRRCVHRSKEAGLLSCVCSDSPELSGEVAGLKPDIILIENPELIGSGRAVSNADPEIISGTVRRVKEVDPSVAVVCGAGITRASDVAAAVNLGVAGVGAASAVIRAESPKDVMMELAGALDSSWAGERGWI